MRLTTPHLLSLLVPLLIVQATARAQDATSPDKTLATVTVTGSNIKRTDSAGPNPVQVLSRAQIEQSGKTTLTDVLRSLSANSGNSFDEQYTGSFAAGSASIGLRGLSPKNTLGNL